MSQIQGKQVQVASTTNSGVINTSAQTLFGQKTFDSVAAATTPILSFKNNVGFFRFYVCSGAPSTDLAAITDVGAEAFSTGTGLHYLRIASGWVTQATSADLALYLPLTGGTLTGTLTLPRLQFDTAATSTASVGQLSWNDLDGTLDLGVKGGNVTLQVGQEHLLRARNNTAVDFVDGMVVRVSGSVGQRVAVGLAQANTSANVQGTIGVTTEPILKNTEGFVTVMGLIHGLNTSGFAEGDVLWLSAATAGAIVNVKPSSPNYAVRVGTCVKSHPTDGHILVSIQQNPLISDLSNVLITTPANADVLTYDSTSSTWKNAVNNAATAVTVTAAAQPAITSVGTLTSLTYSGALTGGTGVVNIGSGQFYKDAAGNIGLGTTAPGVKFQMGAGTSGATALYQRIFGSGTGSDLYIGQSGGAVLGSTPGTIGLVYQNAAAPLGILTVNAQPIYLATGGNLAANVRVGIGGTGDVAIGKTTTAAQARLEVAGGTFSLTDTTFSWANTKFDSQGVARSTLTSPSMVFNGAATDRPELAWYRGARTYPEFAIREHTTADSGGEIWAGNGTVAPTKTIGITAATTSILSTTASTSTSTGALVVSGGAGFGGAVYATSFSGSGAGLTSLTGANVTGTVPSATTATSATTAGTVTTAAQPTITSVGTLTGLTSSGVVNVTNATASTSTSTGALVVSGGAGFAGAVYATSFNGSGAGLTSLTGANVTGTVPLATSATSATTAGTVTTAAQPNITSVGTLTGLTSSGDVSITSTTASTSSTTGALKVSGGAGVAGTVVSGGGFGSIASNVASVSYPSNGKYDQAIASVRGALVVTLPQSWTNTMLTVHIRVFSYAAGQGFDLICSGYNYAVSTQWFNTSARVIGQPETLQNPKVRFGHDGTKCCIVIGDENATTGSLWAYPQVEVVRVSAGYSLSTIAAWATGWAVSLVNDLSTYTFTSTITNTQTNIVLASLGANVAASTGRTVPAFGTYSYNTTNSSLGDTTPTAYWSTIGFGRGGGGVELAGAWHLSTGLWYRTIRDTTDNWTAWKEVLTSASYNTYAPSLTGTGASGSWAISVTGSASTAGTVTTAAQPAITSVGTLTGLTSSGDVSITSTTASTSTTTGALTVAGGAGIAGTLNSANIDYSGTLTGGTGIVNLGSGQFYKDSSGRVGFGTTTPADTVQIGGGDTARGLRIQRNGDNASSNNLVFIKSRGTEAAPTSVATNDALGDLYFFGHDGTSYVSAGRMVCSVLSTPTTGVVATNLIFQTQTAGALANQLIIRDGEVVPGSNNTKTNGSSVLRWSTSYTVGLDVSGKAGFGGITAAAATTAVDVKSSYAFSSANNGAIRIERYNTTNAAYLENIVGGFSAFDSSRYYGSNQRNPDASASCGLTMAAGLVSFFSDSGLTAGTAYTPTTRFRFDQSNNFIFGNGDTNTSPQASTLRGTDASGTDIAGAGMTIRGGRGTGTGAGGSVVIQSSAGSTTGATLNAASTVATFNTTAITLVEPTVLTDTTASTSTTTGALVVSGGVGVAGTVTTPVTVVAGRSSAKNSVASLFSLPSQEATLSFPGASYETVKVTCVADVAGSLAGTYFRLYGSPGTAAQINPSGAEQIIDVWFQVSGTGTQPASGAGRYVQVTITTGATAIQVAAAIQTALAGDSAFSTTGLDGAGSITIVHAVPNDFTAATVGTSGFTVAIVSSGSGAIVANTKYAGGVLAPNGKIYMFPYNSMPIRVFDPDTGAISSIGSAYGASAFLGGVLAPNGKIYAVPASSTAVIEIDPATNVVTAFGSLGATASKWWGGVLAPNGKIYCAPNAAGTILVIDPTTRTTYTIGTGLSVYIGGVLSLNGKIYFIPGTATNVLVVDPLTDTYTTFGSFPGTPAKYTGAALAPNGKIYAVPYNATDFLVIDPTTNTASQKGSLPGSGKWGGAVLAPNGKIYGVPRTSSTILAIDPNTDTASTFGNLGTSDKWIGGVLAPNGNIYTIPYTASTVMAIGGGTSDFPDWYMSAYFNKL